MSTINLKTLGISRETALVRLFNNSRPLGLGYLQPWREPMTESEARKRLEVSADCDYVRGRVIKVDFSTDELFLGLYDRDNGEGAGERALRGD